jgi:hypothetical protein
MDVGVEVCDQTIKLVNEQILKVNNRINNRINKPSVGEKCR